MEHGDQRDSTDDWRIPGDPAGDGDRSESGPSAVLEDVLRAASAAERAALASLVAVEAAGRAEASLRQIEEHLDRAAEISAAASARATTDERIDGLALEIDRAFELIAARPADGVGEPLVIEEPSLRSFSEKADRTLARLRSLEQRPLSIRIGSNGEPPV